jgi:plasmid stabilization system protein ParE
MVQKIVWSGLALKSYLNNIAYLEKDWTSKEVNNFTEAAERKLRLLKVQPNIGNLSNKKLNIRKTLIGKRILLFYRYRISKNEIELIMFFNTWQYPKKNNINKWFS